jgi:hypothetical protein
MDDKITYWATIAFSALGLLLLILNISLVNNNRHMQEEIGQKQAIIARANSVSQANQGLVQAIAEIALKSNDTAARDLLNSQGITLKAPAPAAATDVKAKPTDDKKKD